MKRIINTAKASAIAAISAATLMSCAATGSTDLVNDVSSLVSEENETDSEMNDPDSLLEAELISEYSLANISRNVIVYKQDSYIDTNVLEYTYNDDNTIATIMTQKSDESTMTYFEYDYDNMTIKATVLNTADNSFAQSSLYYIDESGQIIKEITKYNKDDTDESSYTITYEYDEDGYTTKVVSYYTGMGINEDATPDVSKIYEYEPIPSKFILSGLTDEEKYEYRKVINVQTILDVNHYLFSNHQAFDIEIKRISSEIVSTKINSSTTIYTYNDDDNGLLNCKATLNELNELSAEFSSSDTSTIIGYDYTIDENGNMLTCVENVSINEINTIEYQYDTEGNPVTEYRIDKNGLGYYSKTIEY